MRRLLLLSLGVLALVAGAAPAADKDALAGDPRLDQPVKLRSRMITLRRALSDLKDQTRVEVSADDAIAGYTLCAEAENTPLRQVMDCVAEYSGYTWTRSGKEPDFQYRLTQDLKSRNDEERLRLEYLQKTLQPLPRYLQLISDFAAKWEKMDRKDVSAELRRMQMEMEALPVSKERLTAEEQYFSASRAADPTEVAMLRAYQALPAGAQAQLLKGERVIMASGALPGAAPMPETVRAALAQARSQRDPQADPNAPEALEFRFFSTDGRGFVSAKAPRRGLQSRSINWAAPVVTLTPSRVEHGDPPARITGTVRADDARDLQRPLLMRWWGAGRSADKPETLCGGLTLAEIVREVEKDNPDLRLVGDSPMLALGQRAGAPRNENPRQALTAVSKAPGFTLGKLCDEIAARIPMNVHVRKGGLVVFSSAVPYDRKDTSIDPDWIKTTFGPVIESSRFSPQAAGSAALGLTRGQARALGELQLEFLRDLVAPGQLDRHYAFWRLFGSLKRDRQDSFLSGQPLRFGDLALAERRPVQEFMTLASSEPTGAPYDLELSPDQFRALELTLGDPLPKPPGAVAANAQLWGDHRSVEFRLTRPMVSLERRIVCARWE